MLTYTRPQVLLLSCCAEAALPDHMLERLGQLAPPSSKGVFSEASPALLELIVTI